VAVQVLHSRATSLGPALDRAARRFLARLALQGSELSILVVGDAAIRRLNRQWRNKDSATDVLSFPSGDGTALDEPETVLGDVVISFDTANRRAGKSRALILRELNRYLAHGLLHLLGYDHQTQAQARQMAAMEEELLGDRGMI
jgi:probable rRNA maturation factor